MQEYQVQEQGGGNPSLFYLTPSVSPAKMLDNMRVNIARGLPELRMCHPHARIMSIAGGGPSLADTYPQLEGWVCAVNGSLKYLIDQGLRPGVRYACGVCDAQEHMAEIVPADPRVRYYIASVCDPSLFDKLLDNGCDVRLWHITPGSMEDEEGAISLLNMEYDDWIAIGGGSTMGLRWIDIGYALGFRRFHLHGLDSSFRDTTHAYPDRPDPKGETVHNGKRTKVAFLAQIHDFAEVLERMWDQDSNTEITMFGDGLLQDEWNSFREANPTAFLPHPAASRATALLRRLPVGPVCGIEIGVFSGRFSTYLLNREDLKLTMIDSWEGDGAAYQSGAPDWNATLSQVDQDRAAAMAQHNTRFAGTRRNILRYRSLDAASYVDNDSQDFVFIDADHSYNAVKADIEAWWPKVKPGGWLCGHDYGDEQFPDVSHAVHESLNNVELDADYTWFVQKPC